MQIPRKNKIQKLYQMAINLQDLMTLTWVTFQVLFESSFEKRCGSIPQCGMVLLGKLRLRHIILTSSQEPDILLKHHILHAIRTEKLKEKKSKRYSRPTSLNRRGQSRLHPYYWFQNWMDLYKRFGIDYRKPDAVVTKDTCPIPLMEDFIDSLWDANVFKALDDNWVIGKLPPTRKKQLFLIA